MTRETKIGLLLGMGVILLIGIIISDHLSGVQQQDPADFTTFAGDAQQSIDAGDAAPKQPTAVKPTPSNERTSPVIEAPNDFFIPDTSEEDALLRARQAQVPAPTPVVPPVENNILNNQSQLLLRSEADIPTVTLGSTPAPLPHTIERPDVSLPEKPAAVSGIRHTVMAGETLTRIAQRHYGNGDYWRAIAKANPGKVSRDGQVRQGVVLDIPKRTDSQLGSDFIPAGTERVVQVDTRSTASTSRSSVIVVKPGDTLSDLASKHLGSAGKWRELMDANKDKLSAPESLAVGMKLRVPGSLAATTNTGNNSSSRGSKTYTVRPNDNLTKIAERTLGDGDKWQDIFAANKDSLKSPDQLVVGQELKIPG